MRRQIDQIRKVLARFGVSDPGEVVELFQRVAAPSVAEIEKTLRSLELKLPPNITARFVSESLLIAVTAVDPLVLGWRDAFGSAPNLAKIKTGAAEASHYHKTVFRSLNGVFEGSLTNGRIEQEINTGIHRVDIMYDNFSSHGFFSDLKSRLSLRADYVPVECKNYSDDVGSPEYDQLGGRLKDDRQVGVLVVRSLADKQKSFEHIKAKWAKRELVIVLDDNDVIAMHQFRFNGLLKNIDKLLWAKVRSVQLNSVK